MRGRRFGGHVKGHQLVHAVVFAQQHRRGAHARLLRQHRLDLTQLHAEAANLHLVVRTAQALHLPVLVDARQVTRAVQARVVRAGGPGVGQKLLSRQLRAAQVARRHAGAGNAQLARLASGQAYQGGRSASGEAVRVDHLHHHQAVIGQRRANGHRLARLQLGQAGRDRGLGGPVGVEHLARRARARLRPALDQRLGAHLAAQVDDAQVRHILRKQRQQSGHGMQHRHLLLDQRLRQRLGVTRNLARRNPQGSAHEVADPDLLERHVESHREALVHLVAQAHTQAGILAAQKVANAALRDGNALGFAGRAAGVDDVSRVAGLRIRAAAQRSARRQRRQQLLVVEDLRRNAGLRQRIERSPLCHQQSLGAGVFQASGNALGRGFAVKRQPGCARLGNGQLQAEQGNAARQPQAHHIARANAGFDQAVRSAVGLGIQLLVTELALAGHQRNLLGAGIGGGFKNIGQHLVAQQIRPLRATQNNGLGHGWQCQARAEAQPRALVACHAPKNGALRIMEPRKAPSASDKRLLAKLRVWRNAAVATVDSPRLA